jgi:predicted dehydrogenase
MNRRTFVQSAAFAAAAGRAVAASDKVNLAIMGVRGRGRNLTGVFCGLADANISYFCEVDPGVIPRVAKIVDEAGRPQPKVITDIRRALDDKNIDAIVIATPDHWHAPATILGCDAGKDVYVEKPASHNLREGRLMIEAARRNRRIVQLGTQSRSRASTQAAIAYVQSGKIGKIVAAKAWNVQKRQDIGHKPDGPVPPGVDYDTWIGAAPALPFSENRFHYNWHWHWNYGTGDAGNDGIHQLDMARWALGVGAPVEVSGSGGKLYFDDDQQTPDTVNVSYRYGGNKMLIFEMRIWCPYGMDDQENGVAVYGSEGMVHIGRWERAWGYKVFDAKGKLVSKEEEPKDDPHGDQHARNFIDCVKSRQKPNAEIEVGHLSTIHTHLANIVVRTGRNLKFDPANETIPGDAQASRLLRRDYRKHWATPKNVPA